MNETLLEAATRIWTSLGVVAISGARIVGILLAAWLALSIARRALRVLRARIAVRLEDVEAVKRADTLERVFRYITTVVISLIGFIVSGGL